MLDTSWLFVYFSKYLCNLFSKRNLLTSFTFDKRQNFKENLSFFSRVNEYTTIYSELRRAPEQKILIPIAGTFQRGASAAIAQSVPITKRVFQLSPIIYLKAMKNEAEAKGMRRAHLRDAVAMCTLFSYIEVRTSSSRNFCYRCQGILGES